LPARCDGVFADQDDVFLSLALVAAIGWLYGATVTALVSQWWSGPDEAYGLALIGVALVLVWRRRVLFLSRCHPHSRPALGICMLVTGVLLYLIGNLGADVFLTRMSFVLVVAGTVCFLVGPAATRVMAAPLVFTLVAIPLPALVLTTVTLPLQLMASRIAEMTLMVVGTPVVRDGNLLRLPSATLEVAEACSGLRSLCSLGAMAVLLAWATQPSWTKRAVIVAAAVPIAVLMNGLRVALTGLACDVWGRVAARDPWHTLTGWLTFAASLALLGAVRALLDEARVSARDVPATMVRP
jgi:exosortase